MNYTKKLRIFNILNFFCVVYVPEGQPTLPASTRLLRKFLMCNKGAMNTPPPPQSYNVVYTQVCDVMKTEIKVAIREQQHYIELSDISTITYTCNWTPACDLLLMFSTYSNIHSIYSLTEIHIFLCIGGMIKISH